MGNNIERLKQIFKKIGHGEIRIKIENGEPVSIPPQVVEKSFGEINNVTIIDKAIDLTKEQ
jgi:hypothetical protein